MKIVNIVLAAVLSNVIPLMANAEIVVIVNNSVGVDALSQEEASKIFLGKSKAFPNSKPAVPVVLNVDNSLRADFDKKVLKKNPNQMQAYWSQLIFTGRGTPPQEFPDEATVKKLVAENPNMIGFISRDKLDSSVKAVYKAQ